MHVTVYLAIDYGFDLDLLLEATLEKKRRSKPWTVVPYHSWRPDELRNADSRLGGMAYDEANSLLYFVEQFTGPNGRAIIHVYRVFSAAD